MQLHGHELLIGHQPRGTAPGRAWEEVDVLQDLEAMFPEGDARQILALSEPLPEVQQKLVREPLVEAFRVLGVLEDLGETITLKTKTR